MELNMTRALYERVIIEPIMDDTPTDSPIKGITQENTLTKVKVLDWGTDVKGNPFNNFHWEEGKIAYMLSGAPITKVGENKYLCDRRLILGIE